MILRVVSLMKIAQPSVVPATIPSSRSAGRSTSGGGGTNYGGTTGAAATAGGRRDGRKTGRSRVAVNDSSGIAHSGFPLTGGSAVGDTSMPRPGVPGVLIDSSRGRGGLVAARQRLMVAALATAVTMP